MAGGITPNRIVTIPLEDYNSDHYLTLLYQSMVNLGWHIGYFDHDGIIAYTNISWESYSEEVSVLSSASNIPNNPNMAPDAPPLISALFQIIDTMLAVMPVHKYISR